MTISLDKKEDFYSTYQNWCEGHNFPIMHLQNIDQFIVAYHKGIGIYSCIIWNTNSKMCLTGFPVSNPNAPMKLKKGGLEFLYKEMSKYLKKRGYKVVWTTSGTKSVIKELESEGYLMGDESVNHYIKPL